MTNEDKKETDRQKKTSERKRKAADWEERMLRKEKVRKDDVTEAPELMEDEEVTSEADSSDWTPSTKLGGCATATSSRNMTSIPIIATASCRYSLSANATAAVANATLLEYGVISKGDDVQVIDGMKVQRAKDALHIELQEKAASDASQGTISCIFFDGRKDWTLSYTEKDGQRYPCFQKEEHISVVSEPGGHYLFHFTPPEADETATAAEQIAKCLVEWMRRHGVDQTINFIGGDSTNVNSGIWGGVFHNVEKLLGRPLNWLLCGLHLNELPLRHLIIGLDGPTSSDTGFTGKNLISFAYI